jgi:hypothetical protein
MTIYTDAFRMLKTDADICGGAKAHWPNLNVDFDKIQIGSEHAWIDNVLSIRTDLPISLILDKRIVALHGHGNSNPENAGTFLTAHLFGLQRMMNPVPHMSIWHQRWKDGGFRLGYKKTESFNGLTEDQKALVLCTASQELLENADQYCAFIGGIDLSNSPIYEKESFQRLLAPTL